MKSSVDMLWERIFAEPDIGTDQWRQRTRQWLMDFGASHRDWVYCRRLKRRDKRKNTRFWRTKQVCATWKSHPRIVSTPHSPGMSVYAMAFGVNTEQ